MKARRSSKSEIRTGTLTFAAAMVAAAVLPLLTWAQGSVPSPEDTDTAVGCLRTINTAEVTYASTYNKGYSANLKYLGEPPKGGKPSATAAGFVDKSLTSGKKSNYIFTYKAGKPDKDGKISTYTVTARPAKWAKGVKSFFTDQTGIIRWTDENRAPKASDAPA